MKYKLTLTFTLLFATPVFTMAGNGEKWLVREQLIFPYQDLHVHGSSIVALPNGDMLAVWFYGHGERSADDVKIMGARLKKGNSAWSKPFLMADTPGLPDCNPVLFLNKENTLFLAWIAVQANRWEYSILKYRTSRNYNNSGPPVWDWQDALLLKPDDSFAREVDKKFRDLPPSHAGWAEYAPPYDQMIREASKVPIKRSIGWMTRIHPRILKSGRILLPLYSDGLNMSLVAISDDDGKTWHPSLPIVGRGPIQPALAQRKNGDIVAFMRDSGDEPARVQMSLSKDNGDSWSAAIKTDIPNTASVELLALNDGKWAFLGNDVGDGRYRLSLFISDDEGVTWKWKVRLEDNKPGEGSFSYPSLIQTPDGLLHATYSCHKGAGKKSIKYVVIDPSGITD